MPMYALRWPDRSVSITFAESEDEAVLNFDEIADPSNLSVVELDSSPLITLLRDAKNDFRMAGDLGTNEALKEELMEKCYPDLN